MNDATHFWRISRAGRTRPRGRAPEPAGPASRTAWQPVRRGLLRAAFVSTTVAFTAAVLSRIPGATPPGGPAGAPGPEPDAGAAFDEMHAGHRIQGWPLGAGRAELAVFVDGRQLDVMRRADGSYLSSVDHYVSYPTARAAARAAANELGTARLAAVPVHGSHQEGAGRGVHA